MPRRPKSHPCLPPTLLDEFKNDPITCAKASIIFQEKFGTFRHQIVAHDVPTELEFTRANEDDSTLPTGCQLAVAHRCAPLQGANAATGKSWLHMAVQHCDLPLAYEVIRMGELPDTLDAAGITALFSALDILSELSGVQDSSSSRPGTSAHGTADAKRLQTELLVRIATLLIEQHADVSFTHNNKSLLSLAVSSRQWDLVELLLRHGTPVTPTGQLYFRAQADRKRYVSLRLKHKDFTSRPPRHCPCWSGSLLSECHGSQSIEYPKEFLCKCGSKKLYGNCCSKRFSLVEAWDKKLQLIGTRQRLVTARAALDSTDPLYAQQLRRVTESRRLMKTFSDRPEIFKAMAAKMIPKRNSYLTKALGPHIMDMDPAYAHALFKIETFFAQPWERKLSKIESESRMNIWNSCIDEYIASGCDSRPRFEIELGAKIGSHGGPLYRHCEATGCQNVERRDVDKMKRCSNCERIFYCSQTCQSSDWKKHKPACKAKSHRPQELPSQTILEHQILSPWHAGDHMPRNIEEMFASPEVSSLLQGVL